MNYIILVQSGYKVDCSPAKLQKIIKFLRKDERVLTVDHVIIGRKK